MIDIEKILKKVDEFPTLPTIYTALSEIMANPRSTINDAAQIISQDQSSVSKILKAANSSIYGLRVNIDTITQAIFYIGFDEVKNLIGAMSIIKLFSNVKDERTISPVALWKHSIAVGAITRILGEALQIKHLENYFIAGIIHDIGKLFFYKYLKNEYVKVVDFASNNNIQIKQAEKEILGITHTMVGELLAQKWKLPQNLINAISSHNSGFVDGKIDMLVSCVHLANVLAVSIDYGMNRDELIPEPNRKIWQYMNFESMPFTKLLPKFRQDIDESIDLLLRN